MRVIRFSYAILMGVLFLKSCQSQRQNKFEETLEIDSVVSPLSGILWQDTLTVAVAFSECGEWGGHREYLTIQWDTASHLYARLRIDSVNCDTLVRYYPNDAKNPYARYSVYDSTKLLTLEGELLVSKLLQRVLEARLAVVPGANFGDVYSIKTSDGSLKLNFGNIGNYHVINYGETRDKIFPHRQFFKRRIGAIDMLDMGADGN